MSSCQEPLLKSDEEDELVFDRTGLLSNKVTVKPDIRQRGHTGGRRLQYARTVNLCLAFFALYLTGGNVWCLDLWGKKSAPFMQTMHFCFGLGAFIAPLVAEPFLSPQVENYGNWINRTDGNKTALNFPQVRFPHQRYGSRDEISNILSKYANDSETEGTASVHRLRSVGTDRYPAAWKIGRAVGALDKREVDGPWESENATEFLAEDKNSSSPEGRPETTETAISSTADVKRKPKKPFYADGNQLSQDKRWFRSSLKSKTRTASAPRSPPGEADRTPPTPAAPHNGTGVSDDWPAASANESREEEYDDRPEEAGNSSHLAADNGTDAVLASGENSSVETHGRSNSSVAEGNLTLEHCDACNATENSTPEPPTTQPTFTLAGNGSFVSHGSRYLASGRVTSTLASTAFSTESAETLGRARNSVREENGLRGMWESRQKDGDGDRLLSDQSATAPSRSETGEMYVRNDGEDPGVDLERLSEEPKVDDRKAKETAVEADPPSGNSTAPTDEKKRGRLGFLSGLFRTMLRHRLGKFEIAYVILGTYIFVVAFVFLVFLCVNPREPRSRQEEDLDKSRNLTATFKFSAVLLVSLFLCLYVGIEVAVGQLLQTFAVKQYLRLPESTGYFMTYMFWGSFALSRALSVGLAARFSGLRLIFADLIICLVTSVLLVAGANKMETLLWVGVVILGFGMAPVFPASISWIERYLPIDNKTASVFILGAALGQLTIPPVINRFIDREPMVLMYVNMVVNVLCFVTFVGLWLLSSRQGEKYKSTVDRNTYRLANFDEVEDGLEMSYGNSHWQNNYNSRILMKKSAGKVT
ncbi:uncharacterized protein LOC111638531 [Centruroides sculpturatus]|uniref:uncharacterized protein LOC111638531 n=1 Tax=Centruroides sculpturatus TaxID=218467 RepID=UPI000C6E19C5|nr:uncharacterized protein LOC111638531 [Centruroides sculpturatus]